MNKKPAPRPIANAVTATQNTNAAPERRGGGTVCAFNNISAITALSARMPGAAPRAEIGPREELGLLPPGREFCGLLPAGREFCGLLPAREELGPSLTAATVAAC
jgi:hypothetical protein